MADRRASARKTRRNQPILSIRARLIVLALTVIAPLVIERVHGLETARSERIELAHAQVLDLARAGADSQRQIMDSMRGLLDVVARLYARMPAGSGDCNRTLADLTSSIPWLHGIGVAGTDGRILCATDSRGLGLNIADRPYFQTALHSHDFILSDYLISRARGVPGLVATLPTMNDDGTVKGVAVASINLRWIGDLAASAAHHSGTSVLLVDGAGTLIAGSADQKDFVGKNFARNALMQDMRANPEGAMTVEGLDGMRRIFAYVSVPGTNARLAVGLDERFVHSGIDHEISIAYLQLTGFGVLVLLAAWFGGEQLIVRPIRSLARTAARFGCGDLRARAAEEPWIAEFRPLAAALDDMARKMAAREEELRIANEHLDELASLDGLTGLANRRGFDRQLECDWNKAREAREPLALVMIDIDHFKLFNDRYGHVRGDACLRAVGETLSLVTLEDAVLVARYGGEEFALLLPGFNNVRALALGDELRRAVEDLLIVHSEAPAGHVTISIGLASLVPQEGQAAADLVETADRALYAAKRCGRNAVVSDEPLQLNAAA